TGSTALATFRRGGTVSRGIGLVHFGGGVPSRMLAEIAEQPEALRRTFAALLPRIGEVEALADETRQVLFIARGSSDNAAVYGQYLCSARAGRLTTLAAPSLATAYHAALDLRGVLAVAISQSGATEEIVTTLTWARTRGARPGRPHPPPRARPRASGPRHQDLHHPARRRARARHRPRPGEGGRGRHR